MSETNDAPWYVIEAEKMLMKYGTHSPVECLEAGTYDYDKYELECEIQFHLGRYTAMAVLCNTLYTMAGLNRTAQIYPPEWITEAQERKRELEGEV